MKIRNENTACFTKIHRQYQLNFFMICIGIKNTDHAKKRNHTTNREWEITGSGVASIEPTKYTESKGQYIIL